MNLYKGNVFEWNLATQCPDSELKILGSFILHNKARTFPEIIQNCYDDDDDRRVLAIVLEILTETTLKMTPLTT